MSPVPVSGASIRPSLTDLRLHAVVSIGLERVLWQTIAGTQGASAPWSGEEAVRTILLQPLIDQDVICAGHDL